MKLKEFPYKFCKYFYYNLFLGLIRFLKTMLYFDKYTQIKFINYLNNQWNINFITDAGVFGGTSGQFGGPTASNQYLPPRNNYRK